MDEHGTISITVAGSVGKAWIHLVSINTHTRSNVEAPLTQPAVAVFPV